jgi:hypothetical protein
MAIAIQTMYDDVVQYELHLSDNTANKRIFLRALNRALDELSIQTDLATRLTHATEISGNIAIDEQLEYVVATGVAYYMIRMGAAQADPRVIDALFRDTDKRWKDAKGDFWTEHWNQRQATDSESIIGLGYLDS